MSQRSVGAPVRPSTVTPAPEPPEGADDEDPEDDEDEESELVGVVLSGAPGTAVVGAASGVDSDVVTESPSYVNDAGSAPS